MPLRTVAVVLPPRPSLFELGVVREVFGVDRTDDGVPPIDFRICAERPGEPLELDNGLVLLPPYGLEAADDADLVVAAAYESLAPPGPATVETFRRAHARGAWVLSVCSGAFVLGEAGLLDGRRCTTHWRHTAELSRRYPTAEVDPDVLFVEDDRVITSAGTAAGIDACLHHVRCELGAAVASRIARRMVVPPQREGGQRQYIELPVPACSADSLSPLLTWMREHLHQEQPVSDLAQRAAMSPRTFARRFVAETGTTPARWLLLQRLDHARHLLESTDLAVESVAARCGFGSAALLRHHFAAHVGVAPSDYRRTFSTAV
ncbi:helix-turn-helix domain-containing protein [Nocardioides mangrovicus]|uniref:Helix-turn-helix domain-containing protein n=1 Tax=Nocardioides mangrovicus TaxID=2478913 RepID=A0A3L8P0D4_9ACTN|nr:helix-turn-helix domain-containing protein [Nocardioides mangrovicus]RLV48253.1 helix-turn-helix domain-containing protein [Nocardioides mangrovicus]